MKKLTLLLLIFFAFLPIYALKQPAEIKGTQQNSRRENVSIRSEVNPGMELLAIMLWLSNNYQQPMDSKYKAEVWSHFSKYRQHPAILKMKKITFYPDFTENGLLFSNFPDVNIEIPSTSSWFKALGSKENVVTTLSDAKVFAKDTNFWKFYQKQRSNYALWTDKFAKELREKEVVESVDAFFRYTDTRKYPQVTIYLEPLNNWGAHAIDLERLAGKQNDGRVNFQIGPAEAAEQFIDSQLNFSSSRNTIKTVWHESNHIYLTKVLADYDERINKLERLFNAPDLASQNITTWSYAFEENLVRAIVAAITRKKFGEDAYKQEVNTQKQRGFIYTPEIAELITAKYLSASANYANFDAFMPEIISLLEAKEGVKN